jgi:putative endonuclease
MDAKQATGKLGEKLAADFLQQKGYTIVKRNFRHRRNEIDIIARKEGLLVFVEVKARGGSGDWGMPEEAVDRRKASRLISCANAYIFKTDWQADIRFDIIAVELGKETLITHFEDAFH